MGGAPASGHGEFRAAVIVSWPVWAGGYPEPDRVVDDLRRNQDLLRTKLDEAANGSAGTPASGRIEVSIEHFGAAGHNPVRGLRGGKQEGPANSVLLWLHFDASGLQPELDDADVSAILGRVSKAVREFLVRDKGGANLYDVKVRWGWGPERDTTELLGDDPDAKKQSGVEVQVALVWDGSNTKQSTVATVGLRLANAIVPANAYDEAVKRRVMRDVESFLNGMLAQKVCHKPNPSLGALTVACTKLDYSSIFFGFDLIVIGGAAYVAIKDYPDLRQGVIEMANDIRAAGRAIERFALRAFGVPVP